LNTHINSKIEDLSAPILKNQRKKLKKKKEKGNEYIRNNKDMYMYTSHTI